MSFVYMSDVQKNKPGWPFISLTDVTLQSVTTSLYSTPADYTTHKHTQMIVFPLAKTEKLKDINWKLRYTSLHQGLEADTDEWSGGSQQALLI